MHATFKWCAGRRRRPRSQPRWRPSYSGWSNHYLSPAARVHTATAMFCESERRASRLSRSFGHHGDGRLHRETEVTGGRSGTGPDGTPAPVLLRSARLTVRCRRNAPRQAATGAMMAHDVSSLLGAWQSRRSTRYNNSSCRYRSSSSRSGTAWWATCGWMEAQSAARAAPHIRN